MTRKTSRLRSLENNHAHAPLDRLPISTYHDRYMAVARLHRPGVDLESAPERRPLIFHGVLLALPVSIILWLLIFGVAG
jgi:hypothetical protein